MVCIIVIRLNIFNNVFVYAVLKVSVKYRGQDIESLDVLRQGFTHAFLMTFNKKEDFVAFQSHPNHVEFSEKFSAAIENIVLLDFPSTLVKPVKVAEE